MTHRVVQQVKPVVEVVDEREGVWDVVSLRAEENQHSQRDVLCTAEPPEEETFKTPSIKTCYWAVSVC